MALLVDELFRLNGVLLAEGDALAASRDITAIAAGWDHAVRARSDSSVHRLKNLLLRQPVVTIAIVARELGVSEPAADTSVKRLVEAGVLFQSTAGRRNRHWQATEVLEALDEFGARARRQRPGR